MSVCAVVPEGDVLLERAVSAQQHRVSVMVRADPGRGLDAALETGAEWVWVLDGSAVPEPGALEALLAAARRLAGTADPRALASRIVDDDGQLAAAHLPLPPGGRASTVVIRTAERRVLHVRAVSSASVLLTREAVGLGAARFRPEAGLAWTARMLTHGGGFVVPDSVAHAREAGPSAAARGRSILSLVLSRGIDPRERLQLAAGLAETLVQRAR